MKNLFLTYYDPSKVKAGLETYSRFLVTKFPGLELVHADNAGINKAKLFSLLREPLIAKKLGEYVLKKKDEIRPEFIITNAMIGWNLDEKKCGCRIINVQHGTHAAFANAAMKKTDLNFWRVRFIYSYFERLAAKNAGVVISNSEFTRGNVEKYFGINSSVIYPPIDTRLFRPLDKGQCRQKLNLPQNRKIVLFVGRPGYSKGFDIMERTAKKMPELLFLAITSPKAEAENRNIIALGEIKHEELVYYYNAADVLLFPSRFEGFGFVPLEALACNTPVIANKTGVFHDFYRKNVPNTNIVDDYAVETYVSAINKAINTGKKADSRPFIEKNFSLDLFIQKYQEILEQANNCRCKWFYE